MNKIKAFAAASATSPLEETTIPRRDLQDTDVAIAILYCGICHSDIHQVRNEWNQVMPTVYPIVPGHEIVGRVLSIGSKVTQHNIGDIVAVGCISDADENCPHCKAGNEHFCNNMILTYNGKDKILGGVTYGGYSKNIVVKEHFVLKVPKNLSLPGTAPLLCAGITTYSPLKRYTAGPGKKVGIIGLGGLGHVGVKIAKAMGAHVVVFTSSPSKKEDALLLGAQDVVITKNISNITSQPQDFDCILDTVSAQHPLDSYLQLLKPDGVLVLIGAPSGSISISPFSLIMGRHKLVGSVIGGIPETQEMLNFCGEHNITAQVEIIPIQKVNEAYERMLRSDVKYRFVIDMESL